MGKTDLVEAYLARRALDYLVGFTLSPVLWRKLPGSRSAGRVQSVALRLICEREAEIETFKAQEYWTIDGPVHHRGARSRRRLTHLDGRKLDKFDLPKKRRRRRPRRRSPAARPSRSPRSSARRCERNPFPPFTTSTLQQEASRKLGFGASHAMRLAQRLYEGVDIGGETVGLITYMRTDGVSFARRRSTPPRRLIDRPNTASAICRTSRAFYTTKAKNAQEAHEAIRPTDLFPPPERLAASSRQATSAGSTS